MNTVKSFNPMADRYVFDFKVCHCSNGWAQIDTKQDASYFGAWANPLRRTIVTFAEGDIVTLTADSDEEFVAEIRKMQEWNNQTGYGPMKVDWMGIQEIFDQFWKLGLGNLLH
jgi:hypothetical protein